MFDASFVGSLGEGLLFNLFATILVIGSLGVILGRNPVHSVLFLILCFFNAAGLFILLQAELVAMVLVIVYVGAVAVLFLFVVMMLDINFRDLRKGFAKYIPFAILSGTLIAIELSIVGFAWRLPVAAVSSTTNGVQVIPAGISNTNAIGNVIYTDYFLIFQLAGLILLVAMVGAIVLTLRKRSGVMRQDINKQMERCPSNTLTMHKIDSRKGIKI